MKTFYVYIAASQMHGTTYIGVTNDLVRRMMEHRAGTFDGFTKEYGIKRLVYFESTDDPMSAIEREKQLKNWHRPWKIGLIERENPGWMDLFPEISGEEAKVVRLPHTSCHPETAA